MTVNIYLNTVLPEHGGATRILSQSATGTVDDTLDILGKVQPVEGSAAVFRDSLYHDGEALVAGVKYLLVTDVMFVRDEPYDLNVACAGWSDEEKALEDGGNHEMAVAWYREVFRLCPALEQPSS